MGEFYSRNFKLTKGFIEFRILSFLLHSNALCQISGLVYVAASSYGDVVGEEL